MPGKSFSSENYRFGFNGKEKDDEIKGNGNSIDFGARIYDSRLGRWLSLDPRSQKYPFDSPYSYAGNNPNFIIDPDGGTIVPFGNANYISANGFAKIAATSKGSIILKSLINANGSVNGTFYLKEIFFTINSEYNSSTNVLSFAPTSFTPFLYNYSSLGHEINHANDDRTLQRLYTIAGAKESELKSGKFENYLRSVYGDALRTSVDGMPLDQNEKRYNPEQEKISDFKLLSNPGKEGTWDLQKGSYFETSFNKTVENGDPKKYYQRITMSESGEIDFTQFDNFEDLENSRPSTNSTTSTVE